MNCKICNKYITNAVMFSAGAAFCGQKCLDNSWKRLIITNGKGIKFRPLASPSREASIQHTLDSIIEYTVEDFELKSQTIETAEYNSVITPENWKNPDIKSPVTKARDTTPVISILLAMILFGGAISFAAMSNFYNSANYEKVNTSKRIELASQMFEDLHEAMDKLNSETNVEKIEKIQNEIKRLTEILAALQLERKNE